MKNTKISLNYSQSPVEAAYMVSINKQRVKERVMELQRKEFIAACNRFFEQGYGKALKDRLLKIKVDDNGFILSSLNGDFICFVGDIENEINSPEGDSSGRCTSSIGFKFRAFDGKTSRD